MARDPQLSLTDVLDPGHAHLPPPSCTWTPSKDEVIEGVLVLQGLIARL